MATAAPIFEAKRRHSRPPKGEWMLWLISGSLVLGAACGVTVVRLVPFIVFMLGAAAITLFNTLAQGTGRALLNVVIAIVALQIGYEAGIALGAAVRSWRGQRPVSARKKIQEKRQ
jgi:dolichyl-phosphate-mannose--protein O-mannosyl transferase